MSKSLNKVILIGNVGKNPEIHPSGENVVANFSLATSSSQKDAEGNWRERTEWHNLVAFKRTAEIVRDYVKKGSRVYIEGRIQTHEWEDHDSGQKRSRTEVVVNDLILLGDREAAAAGEPRAAAASPASSSPARKPNFPPIDDDDIPF